VKLARTLLAVGRVLITSGVLLLLFVAYQLWGTGIHTQRAQNDARDEFEEQLAEAEANPPTDPAGNPGRPDNPDRPGRALRQPVPHAPPHGEWIGRITIPAIDADFIFFEGVDLDTLTQGPGHYEGTPMPGQRGNAGIAGHRTTYLHPFYRLNELDEGDTIIINYANGSRFRYQYLATHIVAPDQTDVLEYKFDNRLTLTACNPRYSARERIVVSARLLDPPARRAQGEPPADPTEAPDDLRLDGETHSKAPAILWGAAAASVWLAAFVLGRAWRRWAVYLLCLPIFLAVLYGFFENFSHLLPADF
jgi:sortase A